MQSKTPIVSLRKILPSAPQKNEPNAIELVIAKMNTSATAKIDHILYLQSQSSITFIHMEDGSKILSSLPLKKYTQKLSEDHFIRVHPSYVINRSSLSCYLANQNKVILHNSQEIPVSNSKKEGLLKYLKTLMV